METAEFIVPPKSPLQRGLRQGAPRLAPIAAAVLAAHLLLFGSLLVRGWVRDGGTAGAKPWQAREISIPSADVEKGAAPEEPPLPALGAGASAESAPAAAAAEAAPEIALGQDGFGGGVYTVKAGDTLTRIARRHGVRLKALRSANGFGSDRLTIGQKIRLPGPASATSTRAALP